MTDARFEDGDDRPLNLLARDPEDLQVISALLQDAVLPGADLKWDRKARRFVALVNRFRWEDRAAAEAARRPVERVRSLLVIGDVMAVRSQGVARGDKADVLALLALVWQPGVEGTGRLTLQLSGGGAVAIEVEAMDIALRDVTRPYPAPSGRAPRHPI